MPHTTHSNRQLQWKGNSKKYRDNAQAFTSSLETDVEKLTRDTARLEGQLEMLQKTLLTIPRDPMFKAGVRVAKQYWSLFQHGYSRTNPTLELEQKSISRSLLCEDLLFMGEIGTAKFEDQWKQYVTSFPSIQKKPLAFQVISCEPTVIVRVTGHILLRFSRDSILQVYPHLLGNEYLLQKLMGREITMPMTEDFFMDVTGTRIQQLDFNIEFTMGLLEALGSIQEAMEVMRKANIGRHSELKAQYYLG